MTCICSQRIEKWEQKHRVPNTYYVNNDFTNIIKAYESYLELKTGRKHKKHRKTKKTSFTKE